MSIDMSIDMSTDETFMRRALALAVRGAGKTSPNPMVGAVIVRDGAIIGEGWHARYGTAHAEVAALAAAGAHAKGATIYVTLEPCAHHGKTPPCVGALLAAGVRRVVYAVDDPNPIAAGGAEWLRAAGVEVMGGVLRSDCAEMIAPFLFTAGNHDRPFVTLKLAISIDGAIVDASRGRGWLTGLESRRAVHLLRAAADAIAVGIGTALADDPALTVREVAAPRVPPVRVVFDRRARLPLDSTLLRTASEIPVIDFTDGSAPESERQLRESGVQVQSVETLMQALALLRRRGVHHLLVEGGAGLASALMEAEVVDRLITFQAPVILGAGALSAFAVLPTQQATGAPRFRVVARESFGDDLMTTYAVSDALSNAVQGD